MKLVTLGVSYAQPLLVGILDIAAQILQYLSTFYSIKSYVASLDIS